MRTQPRINDELNHHLLSLRWWCYWLNHCLRLRIDTSIRRGIRRIFPRTVYTKFCRGWPPSETFNLCECVILIICLLLFVHCCCYYRLRKSDITSAGARIAFEKEITKAFEVLDADILGRMDYAAAYMGGYIYAISKDTIPYRFHNRTELGSRSTSLVSEPSRMIDHEVSPGNCFAFAGSKGFIQVVLRDSIIIRSVTLSHVSKYFLLKEEDYEKTPKEFVIYGYLSVEDMDGIFLGRFTYDLNGDQHQWFHINEYKDVEFKKVGIQILSNYGGEYTCIYRLRVHDV